MPRRALLIPLLLWLAALARADERAGAPPTAADWAFRDASGAERRPFELKGRKGAVFIFVSVDCPIANAYAPEISRLADDYAPKGFDFYLVYSDPDLKPDEAIKHAREYKLKPPGLLDPEAKLAHLTGAKVTPEAALLSPERKVLYLGRIDDLFAGYGKKRAAPTKRDLREALDAVAAGKPVPNSKTQAIGCFIEDARPAQKENKP